MRVLLTGSSGWLGRHLSPLLTQSGHQVTGFDLVPGIYTQVIGTVADREMVDHVFADHGIEAVIHAGALHQPDIVGCPRQAFVDVNVSGTLNLLEAAVAAQNDRFLFTSTTSLMIRADVRQGAGPKGAWWMDEAFGPLAPRNIYGITKLAAEQACQLVHREHGIAALILRTGRFFTEDDDMLGFPAGANLKANELLNRRLTVEDAAAAHLAALDAAPEIGCDTFILSAPPPFSRDEAEELARDAGTVIARHHPDAAALYAAQGWVLPQSIDRVYDPSHAERRFGWRAATDFGRVLAALRVGTPLPFAPDPDYTSPLVCQEREACMC